MPSTSSNYERWVIFLLACQITFFGAAQGSISVAAYTLFVDSFGAQTLPYVYLLTAVTLSLTVYGFTWLQQRLPLANTLLAITSFIGLLFFVSWYLLYKFHFEWLSFALVPIVIFSYQLGSILPGLQAGRLLDVRQVKRLYPIVNAGLTFGFVMGSVLGPIFAARTNSIASIMLAGSICVLLAFAFLVATVLLFRSQFLDPVSQVGRRSSKSVGQLLKNRYVQLIVVVQMLTTIIWFLTEFIYLEQAESRFSTMEELSAFLGGFGAARNMAAALMMVFIAGRLLNRFGLNFGLLSGPITVGFGLTLIIVGGFFYGLGTALLFWLAVLTYGAHVVLEGGITIPSLKTSYQLLSKGDRVTIESMVGGIGMSIAVGISGLLLLGFYAIPGLTVTHAAILSGAVAVAWLSAAISLYRHYGRLLVEQLDRRVIDEDALTLSEGVNEQIIQKLIQSDDLGKIRLALNVLDNRHDPSLHEQVLGLAQRDQAIIRTEAYDWIERLRIEQARTMVDHAIETETDPQAKGAAIRALCGLSEFDAVEQILTYVDAPQPAVRQGAMVGLMKHGGIDGVVAASSRLAQLAASPDATSRATAANILGDIEVASFHQQLLDLLLDVNPTVRQEALRASAKLKHPRLLPHIIQNLVSSRSVQSEAAIAAKEYGEEIVPNVNEMLERISNSHAHALYPAPFQREIVQQLLRICGQIKGIGVTTLLSQFKSLPDQQIENELHASLSAANYHAHSGQERAAVESALNRAAERCLYTLIARKDVGSSQGFSQGASQGAELLQRALTHAFVQSRQQIFYLLSYLYDSRAMRRAEEQITHGTPTIRAFAMEMLDVTLAPQHRSLVWPLVSESFTTDQSIQSLSRKFDVASLPRSERVSELMKNPPIQPADWIQTCTLFAVGEGRLQELAPNVSMIGSDAHPLLQETAQWTLARLQSPVDGSSPAYRGDDHYSTKMTWARNQSRGYTYLTIEKVALLKEVDIFAETPDHILASVAAIVEQVDIDANVTFIQQDDIGDCMYLIIAGKVLVHQGPDQIFALGPGKSVGELAILDMSPRETSVTSTEPTQLFRIAQEPFDQVLAERPEIARSVIRALSQRVRMTTAAR